MASRPRSTPGGLGWRCRAVRLLAAGVRRLAAFPSRPLGESVKELGLPAPPSPWHPTPLPETRSTTAQAPAPTALIQKAGPLPTWALAPGPRTRVLPRPGDWAPSGRPCRTWTCFSRIRRLLKVRFPSVQYLKGRAGRVGAGAQPEAKACGSSRAATRAEEGLNLQSAPT